MKQKNINSTILKLVITKAISSLGMFNKIPTLDIVNSINKKLRISGK